MEARQHACEQACHLCSHIFLALPAIPPPGLLTIACKLPASYMEKLCCLACEALPADNPAAWGVSCLIDDAGLQTVVDYAAALGKRSVCQRLDAVRYIPAMHVLARRVAPQALKLEGELRRCLDRTKAVHPETSLDRRLSNNFRRAWQWTWPRNGYPDNCPALALLPGSDKWALIDRDLVPRVGDDSLQRMVQYLDDKCRMPGSAGRLKGATTDAVYTSRLAAVLLSLQSSSIDEGRAKAAHHDAQLQDSLVGVARYATATSTQLLQGAASGHSTCECSCDAAEREHVNGEAAQKRAAFSNVCLPCSRLAEGIAAMVLQVLHLNSSSIDPLSELDDGELGTWIKLVCPVRFLPAYLQPLSCLPACLPLWV